MQVINRRDFLTKLTGSAALMALPIRRSFSRPSSGLANGSCWLSVCVPLVIEDAATNLHTDIILTSASFEGLEGYADPAHATDYEIFLYDFGGNAQAIDGANRVLRMTIPAMRTTLIKCGDLLGGKKSFWGGMKIRMWAKGNRSTHVGDLFSAAFVRWNFAGGFDTLHAHPDPLQFQTPDRFFSSMPFPSLEDYGCTLSIFNPYEAPSAGRIIVHAGDGRRLIEHPYRLNAYGSTLFNLNRAAPSENLEGLLAPAELAKSELRKGGSIVIENDQNRVKNFAYMMIKGKASNAMAAEHTIHQGNYAIQRGSSPFGADQSFKARGWVYSTFIFNRKTVGGLNMSSRVYLSAGRPLEDEMWLLAYATDGEGNIQWATNHDADLEQRLPQGFIKQGAIRLIPFQSCELDFEKVALKTDFAGGIGIATSPQTSHVLMKVEVRVHNWGTTAFSHFRPGSRSARALERVPGRGGLASDYVVTGARLKRTAVGPETDSLIGILNLEQDRTGDPSIEVFGSNGFITRKRLGSLPGWACRHFMLSELFPDLSQKGAGPLTLRLTDASAVVIMSALHIDYNRKDVAIDHGSDRFSTYLDYGCQ